MEYTIDAPSEVICAECGNVFGSFEREHSVNLRRIRFLQMKTLDYIQLVNAQFLQPHDNDREIARSKAEMALIELCKS